MPSWLSAPLSSFFGGNFEVEEQLRTQNEASDQRVVEGLVRLRVGTLKKLGDRVEKPLPFVILAARLLVAMKLKGEFLTLGGNDLARIEVLEERSQNGA